MLSFVLQTQHYRFPTLLAAERACSLITWTIHRADQRDVSPLRQPCVRCAAILLRQDA